jgi:hypothetical protein
MTINHEPEAISTVRMYLSKAILNGMSSKDTGML